MHRVTDKIRTEKSADAKSLPKLAADLANDKPSLVTERPARGNENPLRNDKPTIHSP